MGAKYLAKHLGGRMIFSLSELRSDECLINWGKSSIPTTWHPTWLNRPEAVSLAIHKLTAFRLFAGACVPCPEWTQSTIIAQHWLQNRWTVLARTTEAGHGGKGINILSPSAAWQPLPDARFYSKHIQHDEEFRVHVFRGKLIAAARKEPQSPDANRLVRSLNN